MSEGKARELEVEKAARNYCDETGSMYFEYTDASNELIDAFKAGFAFAENKLQKENEALKARLVKAKEVMKAVNKCFTPPCVVDSKKCICRGKSVIGENYDPGNFDPDCYVYFEIEKAFKDLEAEGDE